MIQGKKKEILVPKAGEFALVKVEKTRKKSTDKPSKVLDKARRQSANTSRLP
jgi:hypothetical protein